MNTLNTESNQHLNRYASSFELSETRAQGSINVFNFLLDAIRGQVLTACIELGILDLLADGLSINEISRQLHINHEKLVLFLNALASMQVLEKFNDQFVINPLYSELLVRNRDTNIITTFLHLYKVRYRSSADIIDILTDDISEKVTQPFASPEFWDKASDNLFSFHKSVMAERVFSMLKDNINLAKLNKMMDLGAGSEVLAQLLVKQFPNLIVYIQDQTPLIETIEKRLSKTINTANHSSLNNIHFIAGDYNDVEFPQPLDLVLSSMSLYYATDTLILLQKVFDALAPKGIFVSLHEGLSNDRTSPEEHVLGRLIPALSGNDTSFVQNYIASLMHTCGFQDINISYLSMPQGEMQLIIGYKS